ncbi:unnamed protein product [Didymodactylos carnosus]|uniref:Uncharacterized protein n=1 Tax=Didymodactylos carnosus TaxID=1234261 RepID=A0A8S2CMD8_9BILA|nr:unnamed protein product [Didymodactylos carnosus]CAF3524374.1 unnamed protein product [Didymodactylos carnosus]
MGYQIWKSSSTMNDNYTKQENLYDSKSSTKKNDTGKKGRAEEDGSKKKKKSKQQKQPLVKATPINDEQNDDEENDEQEDTEHDQEVSTPEPESSRTPSTSVRKRHKKKSSGGDGILANKNETSLINSKGVQQQGVKTNSPTKDGVELAHEDQSLIAVKTKTKPQATVNPTTITKQALPLQTSVVENKQQQPAPVQDIKQVGRKKSQKDQPPKQQLPLSPSNQSQGQGNQQHTESNRNKLATPPAQGLKNVCYGASILPSSPQQQRSKEYAQISEQTETHLPPRSQPLQKSPVDERQVPNPSVQTNGFSQQSLSPINPPQISSNKVTPPNHPIKMVDLLRALPTSQSVVTELMLALDTIPLSDKELDVIMYKIANKQVVLKSDWNNLQRGQKLVDPQVHIGQIMDDVTKSYHEEMTKDQQAILRLKDLTNELNLEKKKTNDLIKQLNDKETEKQILLQQFDTKHKQEMQMRQQQSLPPQQQQQQQQHMMALQRLTEENQHLQQQLQAAQIHHQKASPQSASPSTGLVQMLTTQLEQTSVKNGNLEKQLTLGDKKIKDLQKEKDDLYKHNQDLTKSAQEYHSQMQTNQQKVDQLLNELNQCKTHLSELENENQIMKQQEVVVNHQGDNSENETLLKQQLEQLNEVCNKQRQDIEDSKQLYENKEQLITELEERIRQQEQMKNDEQQTKQGELKQREEEQQQLINQLQEQLRQIENKSDQLNKEKQTLSDELENNKQLIEQLKVQSKLCEEHESIRHHLEESNVNELNEKSREIEHLRNALEEATIKNQKIETERNEFENSHRTIENDEEKYRQTLMSLLQTEGVSDDDKVLQISSENKLRILSMESENNNLKRDIEAQVKEIEQTVQAKEELLINDLKSKELIIDNILKEKDILVSDTIRLKNEIDRLNSELVEQSSAVNTTRQQLEERDKETIELDKVNQSLQNERIRLTNLIRLGQDALSDEQDLVQQLGQSLGFQDTNQTKISE